jgi:DNA-directed RNA polymerase specialized sigma24 family protein
LPALNLIPALARHRPFHSWSAMSDKPIEEQLRRLAAQLQAAQQQVLLEHEILGWTYSDIARHMGLGEDAVVELWQRGRSQLQQLFLVEDESRGTPSAWS